MRVESTEAMLVPSLRRSVGAAEPVTTISERFIALTLSATSSVTMVPDCTATVRDTGWYPSRRTVMARAPVGTPVRAKLPVASLIVPIRVSATIT